MMQKEVIEAVEKEAVRQLLLSQEARVSDRLKQEVKRAGKRLLGRNVLPPDSIFWPKGMIALALLRVSEERPDSQKEQTYEILEQYFDYWIKKGMPIFYLDDILSGYALLLLYEKTGEKKYLPGIEKMGSWLLRMGKEAVDEKGSLLYRPSLSEPYIFVDSIGMVCPFLALFGRKWGEEEAVRLSLRQIDNMLSFGMDEKLKLPYHGYTCKDGIKHGIVGWGRALGWMLLGMSGTWEALLPEQEGRNRLGEAFRELTDTSLSYQREDGSFGWQLTAMDGPKDTSAAGMILWAVSDGLRNGSLRLDSESDSDSDMEKYETARRLGAQSIYKSCKAGIIGDCSGECQGFGQYPQYYGAYPWAQGPGLVLLDGQCRR